MKVIFVSFFIVILDQVSKLLVKGVSLPWINVDIQGMRFGESIPVIGTFLQISFIENAGMVFGISIGEQTKYFLALFTIAASVGLLIYLYYHRMESLGYRLGIAMMLGGALGNLLDRVFYGVLYNYESIFMGNVVDWIDFDFFDIELFGRLYDRAPVFNIADFAIIIGVVLLLSTIHKKQSDKPEKMPLTGRTDSTDGKSPEI